MASNYSERLLDYVEDFLRQDDWKFETNREKGFIRAGVNLSCKLKTTTLFISIHERSYNVYARVELGADEDCRPRVSEYLTRANYGLLSGNFELDFSDGDIRYKTYVNCDGTVPSFEIVKASIYLPIQMLERYGNNLIAVMFGIMTPEDACEAAERN